MKRFWMAFCVMVATTVLVPAQAPEKSVRERVIEEARANTRVMEHLDHLVNKIGPRLTGSLRLNWACDWAVQSFRGFGLANAHTEPWGEVAVGFDRSALEGKMVAPEEKKFELTTRSWTPGTNGRQRAHAVLAPRTKEDVETLGDSLRGAWVVARSAAARFGEAPAAQGGDVQSPPLTTEEREAVYEKYGVLGTVVGSSSELVLTSGNMRTEWEKWPKRPSISIRRSDWEAITKAMTDGQKVVLEFNIGNHFTKGPIPVSNVIADIVGTEFPDQYVIVGGHIDSWDGATGTTDNGTGTATTMEAARLLMAAGAKPRRTIRFMLWSGEEQGLLGSREWIKQNPDMLPKISAVLVHDGGTAVLTGINVTKELKAEMDKACAGLNDINPKFPFTVNEVANLPAMVGSDNDSFVAAGVPGFFWNQSRTVDYNYTHHTQHDKFEAAVAEMQQQTSIIVALTALGIANLDNLLDRKGVHTGGGGFGGGGGRRLGVDFDESRKVTMVMPDGAAAKAGLKVGDKLISVGGVEIKERADIRRGLEGGGEKKIMIERDGKPMELVATWPTGQTPASQPAPPAEKKN